MKKITALILSMIMLIGCFGVAAFADDEITVTLRIEGAKEHIYSGSLSSTKTNLTEFLKEVDAANDSFEFTMVDSAYGTYVSAINGLAEKEISDGSGWGYLVNGVAPATGIDGTTLKNGDVVVFYYYDYTTNFQFPKVDTSKINDGILTFTSDDTVYDENWNVSVVTNPVTDMTVVWYYGDGEKAEYVTDANGQITIDENQLTKGTHKIAISKYDSSNKLSLVLTLPEDYAVEVTKDVTTGDNMAALFALAAIAGMAVVMTGFKKRAYEK